MTRGSSMEGEGQSQAAGAVSQRLALHGLDYPVPARANRLDFMLGALTLAALTVLALTGMVLTQYYNPAPLAAHGSMQYLPPPCEPQARPGRVGPAIL